MTASTWERLARPRLSADPAACGHSCRGAVSMLSMVNMVVVVVAVVMFAMANPVSPVVYVFCKYTGECGQCGRHTKLHIRLRDAPLTTFDLLPPWQRPDHRRHVPRILLRHPIRWTNRRRGRWRARPIDAQAPPHLGNLGPRPPRTAAPPDCYAAAAAAAACADARQLRLVHARPQRVNQRPYATHTFSPTTHCCVTPDLTAVLLLDPYLSE